MKEYLNSEICSKCGGKCCLRMPGCYTPNDITRIFRSVEDAIQSGLVAIDWWEAEGPLYYMRAAVLGVSNLYDPSWGGQCIHWSKEGCKLSREQMPTFCKTLEPKIDGKCDDHIKKHNEKYLAGLLWKRSNLDLSKREVLK